MTPEERLQATIDHLSLELAQERAEHAETRADLRALRHDLDATRRRERIWRRVAEWMHYAHDQETS